MFSERIAPSDIGAEQAVLGSCLIDREAVEVVAGILRPEDFYVDKHRDLYVVILALSEKGDPVDLITVQHALGPDRLADIGGLTYLTSLINTVPTTVNVKAHAEIVLDRSQIRLAQTAARRLVDDGYETASMREYAAKIDAAMQEAVQVRDLRGYTMLSEAVVGAYGRIEAIAERKGEITGVPSGFRHLDGICNGFQPSDLIIVAARPSIGKTAFTLNVARNAAVSGKRVGFFSLEMSTEQLTMRLLAAEAFVESSRIRSGYVDGKDWERLGKALAVLSELPIAIDDSPEITVAELRAKARRMKREQEIDLLIVDYLQLMRLGKSSANRNAEVTEISRSLKALARELSIPVIVLSQLSRDVEKRQEKRPVLSDLRDSGAIEQDADLVAFLYRDDYYDRESEHKGVMEVIIAKHRNGPLGTASLYFMKEVQRMIDAKPGV